MPEERTKAEPRPLSTEYHKARRQVLFWAGLLFIWELVGIDLEKAKDTGGNAGAIISAIRSPQAVPWVLLILVAYFLFKMTIEWHQCNVNRRVLRPSKIDFWSAWVIPLAAYTLYAFQAVRRVQVADLVSTSSSNRFLLILTISAAVAAVVMLIRDFVLRQPIRRAQVLVATAAVVAAGTTVVLSSLGLLGFKTAVFLCVLSCTYPMVNGPDSILDEIVATIRRRFQSRSQTT